ncbi:MAG: hypothetical protein KJ666_04305 [Bacteroidetes bacterium]|nr:hypothetical protein [Bacteroidota bacterium]MBU2586045.1 hypothetical protein [Bacteroidota bacterium]
MEKSISDFGELSNYLQRSLIEKNHLQSECINICWTGYPIQLKKRDSRLPAAAGFHGNDNKKIINNSTLTVNKLIPKNDYKSQ